MHFQRPRPKNDDERILPLINVVFLLLIFFMLAGHLATSDPFKITPVHSSSTATTSAPDMLVLVGADGKLALDGVTMDKDLLKSVIKDRMPANAQQDDAVLPQVQLKADAMTQASEIVEVMELLREAGIKKLKLLTIPVRR